MKPLSWDKQLGLASPLKCAANQSGQTNNPSKDKNEVGLDVSHHIHLAPEGRGKYFFLDIPSHRMSEIAFHEKAGRSQVGPCVSSSNKVFLSRRVAHCRHPSIRTLNERFLFARCKLGVLVSVGAAT